MRVIPRYAHQQTTILRFWKYVAWSLVTTVRFNQFGIFEGIASWLTIFKGRQHIFQYVHQVIRILHHVFPQHHPYVYISWNLIAHLCRYLLVLISSLSPETNRSLVVHACYVIYALSHWLALVVKTNEYQWVLRQKCYNISANAIHDSHSVNFRKRMLLFLQNWLFPQVAISPE